MNETIVKIINEDEFTYLHAKQDWQQSERGVLKRNYIYDQRITNLGKIYKCVYGVWIKDRGKEKYTAWNTLDLTKDELIKYISNLASSLDIKKLDYKK